ncbi:hypothetical protein [Inquilinus limosus]|uniref:Uncharacterized protein n=1 Tax=Inquilinus limosus MP06 TaxID=1398085 RepID=A0A0A0DG50_9PROT|nr:hypothetical protein [Inquilinus limosus]KGM35942.1 hypothetical protein P409_01525 [Inquilinus limosus MP06]
MRILAGLVAAAWLAAPSSAPAAGSPDPKALAEAITTLYVPLGLTRAVVASCDRADAPNAAAHAAALEAWRRANDADRLERLLERTLAQRDGFADARAKLEAALQSQADSMVQKTPLLCGALPALFGGKTFALAANAGPARGVLEAFIGPAPRPKTLYSVGQLSALAAEARRQAPGDEDEKTDWASDLLGRLGMIAVSGRAVDDDRLRQWTVDQQSLWTASCDFDDEAEEKLFAREQGRDVVVAGRIGRVYDFKVITLEGCRLLDGPEGIARASIPEEPGLTAKPKTLFSIAQLSAVAKELFRRTPGQKDDDKVDAVSAAMQRLGPIALSGRSDGDDRLRQWLPEQRSIWSASCDFADDAEKKRFERTKGRDITVVARISRVYAFEVFNLSDCRLLDDPSRLARSDLPEAGGLEYRPPEAAEVNAGPDKGLPAGQIEAMLFREQFQVGMNPGGGTYTDRNEESFLLLKDGTAYRYEFDYPPTDLDAEQTRRRAPQDWSRWERPDQKYVMTAAAGERADLPSFTVLKPFPPDSRLDHSYYYLNVSMGGVTTRIDLTFRPDGTFERRQGGSFFMQSMAGTGPDGGSVGVFSGGMGAVMNENGFSIGGALKQRDSKGRYRLDGYALQLTADDGTVTRLRIGVPGDDVKAPDTLNIGGTSYWDAEKEK